MLERMNYMQTRQQAIRPRLDQIQDLQQCDSYNRV